MNPSKSRLKALKNELHVNWQLYILVILPIVYVILFMYYPMYGIQIAFKDYIAVEGISGSPWVGLEHFEKFIDSYEFKRIFMNTLRISAYSLIAGFPMPIILALSINVVKNKLFKKSVQMITYAPYFISTVVMVGIMLQLLSTHDYGVINNLLSLFGIGPIPFMTDADLFDHVYVWSGVWQGMGWNSIIYIAALSSVDQELYEAAELDGCSDARYFFSMVLPLSKAIIAVLVLFYAIGHWNAYFNAFLYLNDRAKFPLQLILREILIANSINNAQIVDPEIAAAKQGMAELLKYSLILVSTVPVMCLYPFVQKYFVKGVMIGSVKG